MQELSNQLKTRVKITKNNQINIFFFSNKKNKITIDIRQLVDEDEKIEKKSLSSPSSNDDEIIIKPSKVSNNKIKNKQTNTKFFIDKELIVR